MTRHKLNQYRNCVNNFFIKTFLYRQYVPECQYLAKINMLYSLLYNGSGVKYWPVADCRLGSVPMILVLKWLNKILKHCLKMAI